jgi:multiple sugar transport system substrate-binding protein
MSTRMEIRDTRDTEYWTRSTLTTADGTGALAGRAWAAGPLGARRTRRRSLGSAALGAATPLALAACGGLGQTEQVPAGSGAPVAYRDFSYWTEGRRPDMLKHMKRLIEEKYPRITYTLEFLSSGTYAEVITGQFAAGTPPDFIFSPPNRSQMVDRGDVLDTSTYMARSKFKWDDYLPVGDTFKSVKGRLVGVPFVAFASALFYNKTAWEKAGFSGTPMDWTWDDLLTWGKAASRDDRFFIQSFAERNTEQLWGPWVYGNGGRLVTPDKKKTAIAEPASIEAFEYLADLTLKHNISPTKAQYQDLGVQNFGALYTSQRALVQLTDSGSFAGANQAAVAAGYKWDVGTFPKSKRTGKSAVLIGTSPYSLSAKVKEPDLAWEVLRFMASQDVQTQLGVYQVSMPALKSALSDAQGWLKPPPESTKAYNDYVIRDGQATATWDGASDVLKAVYDNLQPGLEGKMAMKEACQSAAQAGDVVLDQLRQQGRLS